MDMQTTIETCPGCSKPAHASETDDAGYHPACTHIPNGTLVTLPDGSTATAFYQSWDDTYRTAQVVTGGTRVDIGWRREQLTVSPVLTIKVIKVDNREGRDLIQAVGLMPGGQELIRGMIHEGHDLTARTAAIAGVADWIREHRTGWTLAIDDTMGKCPTCSSPAPHLHPAVQHGGECHVCLDQYHRIIGGQNTIERIRSLGLEPMFPVVETGGAA